MTAPPDLTQPAQPQPTDLEALFNTSEYFDVSAMSPAQQGSNPMLSSFSPNLGEPSAPYDRLETLQPDLTLGASETMNGMAETNERMGSFDYSNGTFGGEMMTGEGMDTVSDGLKGQDGQQGL